jgi:hypothetical protein
MLGLTFPSEPSSWLGVRPWLAGRGLKSSTTLTAPTS